VRIAGGRLKGRRLKAPEGRTVRPSADRTRQSVFNVISHGTAAGVLEGAIVLDAFAGTGAYGIEALSRGAGQALFIENGRAALGALSANLAELGLEGISRIVRADACKPPPASLAAGLAFLDPPYREGLSTAALAALAAAGWLAPDALIVLECGAREALTLPAGFALLETRRYGAARVHFLRYVPA
jgi:16S rRNA (guanine966-N2)-methyltransferase